MRSLANLAELLLPIPRERRGTALQCIASNRPELLVDGSVDFQHARAAFAHAWEMRYDESFPEQDLTSFLQPPMPIGTVLEFNKVLFTESGEGLNTALSPLLDFLHSNVRKERNREIQLQLFGDIQDAVVPRPMRPTSGRCVDDLRELVSSGCRFSTIYADPPWSYENVASRAAAENHYQTMSVDEICADPVSELAANNAHLHLWTTNAFLRPAFDVIEAWGFKYKSCFIWTKPDIGMGNYWRVAHEFLLLGVRGSLPFLDNAMRSWIESRRTTHSQKPAVVRTLIERASPGPYLELYGREELPLSDWTVYGNQIECRLF